jgi:hypothetical protein
MFQGTVIVGKTREKGFDKGVTDISNWENDKVPFTNLRLLQIQSYVFDPIEETLENSLPISVEFLVKRQVDFIEDIRQFALSIGDVLRFVLSKQGIEVTSRTRIIDSPLEPLAEDPVIPKQVTLDSLALFLYR